MTAIYRSRSLGPVVRDALENMPVVVVTGLRQVGKSTFLQHQRDLAKREYVTLDDFAQLEAARRNPETFVRRDEPLSIDEAQKCPELLAAIKRVVDHNRRPGRFLLSGSANFALLRGVSESLAGRAVYFTLHPFSRWELARAAGASPFLKQLFETGSPPRSRQAPCVLVQDIVRGGLPPVCLGLAPRPEIWFKGYEQTYLERDVRDLARVADLVSFRHLLHLAALRTAQILNISELARDAKLKVSTASRYLDLLEASFAVTRLGPHLTSRASRLIKSPKLYVSDSGLATHLLGLTADDLSGDEPLRGALFETYVAQNLASLLEASWPQARLGFWHVQGRYEVDFVIEAGRDSLGLEVKAGSRWEDRDLSGLRVLLQRSRRCRAAVLAHNGTDVVQLEDRIWAVPLGLVLS